MFFKFRSYLKFLLKSTNHHGIHSPFVFDFLTKCLYTKPRVSREKTHNVLLKSIPYFNARHVCIKGNTPLKKQVSEKFPNSLENDTLIDILYFESTLSQNPDELFSNFQLHNDSLVLFNNIYESTDALTNWTRFSESKVVTVSMDLFYCGLLFIRKEQVKQHFTIRI
ncbi:MAG: hypothetical protein AAGD17_01360 [Bacteroidota bacterium]